MLILHEIDIDDGGVYGGTRTPNLPPTPHPLTWNLPRFGQHQDICIKLKQ